MLNTRNISASATWPARWSVAKTGGGVHAPRALDDADGEARQVVLTGGVQVGELRGLAADEGAAREPAAGDDALHDRLDARRVKTRGADVVEEIEGLGAVDEDVVDAHG